jgi:predicted phosphate transport protein (TIGR00153 family)
VGFKEWIIPQDKVFFDLLERHVALAGQAAATFHTMVDNWANVEAWRTKIRDLEHQADQVGHEVFDRLNRTFITPIDREDIARLAHALDDIVDAIHAATNRIALLEIPAPTPPLAAFIITLEAQIKELDAGVRALRRPKSLKTQIPGHVVEVHRLENVADRALNEAIGALFKTNDAIQILKYKEIYEFLEDATDRCEDVADVLQDILRKHG